MEFFQFVRPASHSGWFSHRLDTSMANRSWAVELVEAVGSSIGWGRVAGVEIGNEPDDFHDNGVRSPNYTLSDYLPEFGRG